MQSAVSAASYMHHDPLDAARSCCLQPCNKPVVLCIVCCAAVGQRAAALGVQLLAAIGQGQAADTHGLSWEYPVHVQVAQASTGDVHLRQ